MRSDDDQLWLKNFNLPRINPQTLAKQRAKWIDTMIEDKNTPPHEAAVPEPTTEEMSKAIDAKRTSEHQLDIPEKRDFNVVRIGNIPYDNAGGSFSGCKLLAFDNRGQGPNPAVEAFNQFFTDNAGLMVVQMWVDDTGQIVAMVTNTLTQEQLEVIKTRSSIIEREVQEIMEAKAKAAAEQDAKIETETKRLMALAKVGEHCEKNHGSIIKQMRAKKGKN